MDEMYLSQLLRLSLVPASHYRRYRRALHIYPHEHSSSQTRVPLKLPLLQSRFSHLHIPQHDVLATRQSRPASLAVQPRDVLGSRAALSKHIRSEVRHCARKDDVSLGILGVVSTTTLSFSIAYSCLYTHSMIIVNQRATEPSSPRRPASKMQRNSLPRTRRARYQR